MRLPSKRLLPYYYEFIKNPIALDDIKKKLDNLEYPTFESCKRDFDQLFVNAKRFNERDSAIWLDAKFLHVSACVAGPNITLTAIPETRQDNVRENDRN